MPRTKIGVTLNNLLLVRQYFERAIKDNRLWTLESYHPDFILKAIKEFNLSAHLFVVNGLEMREAEKARLVLQQWIDHYVEPNKWQRCLKTLRQRKSRKRLGLHHVDLNHKIYGCVKELAEKYNISLTQVIYKLAKAELHRLQENAVNESTSEELS